MPKVGGKKFSYDKKGMKQAKAYAKKTGKKMDMYYGGGMVDARNRSEMYMMEDGGKVNKFGMLSVKAGIDNNPKATQADRIAGAKKGAKKMMGGGKVHGMKKMGHGGKVYGKKKK